MAFQTSLTVASSFWRNRKYLISDGEFRRRRCRVENACGGLSSDCLIPRGGKGTFVGGVFDVTKQGPRRSRRRRQRPSYDLKCDPHGRPRLRRVCGVSWYKQAFFFGKFTNHGHNGDTTHRLSRRILSIVPGIPEGGVLQDVKRGAQGRYNE